MKGSKKGLKEEAVEGREGVERADSMLIIKTINQANILINTNVMFKSYEPKSSDATNSYSILHPRVHLVSVPLIF
jgi:hypothetical protein